MNNEKFNVIHGEYAAGMRTKDIWALEKRMASDYYVPFLSGEAAKWWRVFLQS